MSDAKEFWPFEVYVRFLSLYCHLDQILRPNKIVWRTVTKPVGLNVFMRDLKDNYYSKTPTPLTPPYLVQFYYALIN